MVKIAKAGGLTQTASFSLVPKEILLKDKSTRIRLDLPANPPLSPKAVIHTQGRKISYSKRLKTIMRQQGLKRRNFRSLEKEVRATLRSSRRHPERLIGFLDSQLKNGFTADFRVLFQKTVSCPASQVVIAPQPQLANLNFTIVPRRIEVKGGRPRIDLGALLTSPCSGTPAELRARSRGSKTTLHYSTELLNALKSLGVARSALKPLEEFLITTIKKARQTPEFPVSLLFTFLDKGVAPSFNVSIPQLASLVFSSSSSS